MNLISDLTQNIHKIVLVTAILLFAVSCEYFDSANDPVVITGKITDSSGAPVAGVKVYARTYLYNDSTTSTADGKYKLELSKAGVYMIDFQHENYTLKTLQQNIGGGDWVKLDVSLSLLSEDAYMRIPYADFTIHNTNNSFIVKVNTNVEFTASSTVDWLEVKDSLSLVSIRSKENENSQSRVGTVIVEGEFGLRDTINIEQQQGPVLRVINYSGKDGLMKFPENVPFIKVSRAVTVTGLEVYPSQLNLTPVYSDDSTTISFPDIKADYFREQTIQYTVSSSDGVQLSGSFALKIYEICCDNNFSWGTQKVIFTRDKRSIWLYQSVSQGASTLDKYDITNNFAKEASINLQSNLVSVTYNPYNNTLYLQKQYPVGTDYLTDMEVYSAATGSFISKFTLERKWDVIGSMVFDDKGLGLGTYNGKIYSIDAKNDNRMEVLTENAALYDPHQVGWLNARSVNICNNYSTYVLYGTDTSGKLFVYTYNSATNSLITEYSGIGYNNLIVGNISNEVVLINTLNKTVRYIDFKNKTYKIIALKAGLENACLLKTNGGQSVILSEDASIIDVASSKQTFFNSGKKISILAVSDDNTLVVIKYNNKLYLFRSEMFADYFTKFNSL